MFFFDEYVASRCVIEIGKSFTNITNNTRSNKTGNKITETELLSKIISILSKNKKFKISTLYDKLDTNKYNKEFTAEILDTLFS